MFCASHSAIKVGFKDARSFTPSTTCCPEHTAHLVGFLICFQIGAKELCPQVGHTHTAFLLLPTVHCNSAGSLVSDHLIARLLLASNASATVIMVTNFCRDDVIRTRDPSLPKRVLYQAELHPVVCVLSYHTFVMTATGVMRLVLLGQCTVPGSVFYGHRTVS